MRAYTSEISWLRTVCGLLVTSDIQILERPNISSIVEKADDTIAWNCEIVF